MFSPEAQHRVDPEGFLREQRAQHTHVRVYQRGPSDTRWYVVIGYDENWAERERTHISEDGCILSGPFRA